MMVVMMAMTMVKELGASKETVMVMTMASRRELSKGQETDSLMVDTMGIEEVVLKG